MKAFFKLLRVVTGAAMLKHGELIHEKGLEPVAAGMVSKVLCVFFLFFSCFFLWIAWSLWY